MEAVLSPKCTPEGRQEGIAWLACGSCAPLLRPDHLPDLLRALALGAGDKAAGVRGSAAKLAEALGSTAGLGGAG